MKPPPIRDQSESSQISQSQGFFSKLLERLKRFVSDTENIKAEGWADYVEKDYELINTCLNDLAQLGREDLGTTR